MWNWLNFLFYVFRYLIRYNFIKYFNLIIILKPLLLNVANKDLTYTAFILHSDWERKKLCVGMSVYIIGKKFGNAKSDHLEKSQPIEWFMLNMKSYNLKNKLKNIPIYCSNSITELLCPIFYTFLFFSILNRYLLTGQKKSCASKELL